ncbi:MAG: ribonuclease R [Chlorobi bacterium]|nr:ribonuclease R [Chlorobiota bacterium]
MKNKIKSFFKKYSGAKIKTKTLAKKLGYTEPHKYAEMKAVLHALFTEGFLDRSGKRYFLNKVSEGKLIGTLQVINDGNFGFVKLNNKNFNDIFIPERGLGTALNGDEVEVTLFAKQRGKNLEGEITRIIKRKHSEIVGTLRKTKSFYFVVPDEKGIHRDIYINRDFLKNAKNGDKVVVGNLEWEHGDINPEGEIIEVLGKAGSHEVEIASIAKEFDLPFKFPKEVLDEVDNISDAISSNEIKKRVDLRKESIVTIDPKSAKDFDDAVSLKVLKNGNFLVGVHIADVSHYVPKKSALYKEALKRGTSVYLVGKVIPMLPEKLSNNVCSLVPNKDRLTFSVEIEFTPRGKVVSHKIFKSVINSKRRFTYEEVQEILNKKSGEHFDMLFNLMKTARILRKKRMKTGSINFITPEVHFVFDEKGDVKDITISKHIESHELIEEYMLLANQLVAKEVNRDENGRTFPFVYRIHDKPDKEKLEEFGSFVRSLGYFFNPNAGDTSLQLRTLLESAKNKPEEAVINEIAIRSMAKAIYSTENIGHYGLGFSFYTHFTSPIRRFPDLIVHQLIFEYETANEIKGYKLKELENICIQSSNRERAAVDAEREMIKIKQIQFLNDKIGEEYQGIISGVTNFGLFIKLNHTLAEGLVHIKDLDDDYYVFDEKNYTLRGKSKGKKYRLGDQVIVKLISVNHERKEINFTLAD